MITHIIWLQNLSLGQTITGMPAARISITTLFLYRARMLPRHMTTTNTTSATAGTLGSQTEAYESFVELYHEFEDVRRSVFEYLTEQDVQTESTYDVGQNKPPQEYTTEERLEWGQQQQRFFFSTMGASLEFVEQGD